MRLKKLNPLFFPLLLLLILTACGDEAAITPTSAPPPPTNSASTTAPPTATLAATTAIATNPVALTPAVAATPVPTSATATPTTALATLPGPQGGLTLKAAFGLADPEIKGWQSDVVYISMSNPPDNNIGMDPLGKSQQWYFEALSPTTFKRSFWLVKSSPEGKGVATKSTEDTLSKERSQQAEGRKLPPLADLIDTNRLMEIARQNGGTKSDRAVGTRLARSSKEGEALAFDLLFYEGEKVLRLRIDAQSGKLLDVAKG